MKPAWERVGDAMLDWGGYLLLAVSMLIVLAVGDSEPAWRITTLAIVSAAAAWIYVMWTRLPAPKLSHRVRNLVFFAGIVGIASVLMVRHPLFFVFMISGFFYATALRPLALAVVGVTVTSILVNTLIAGFPQSAEGWTFYLVIIVVQSVVISGATVFGERVSDQSEERRQAPRATQRRAAGERRAARTARRPGARGGHP